MGRPAASTTPAAPKAAPLFAPTQPVAKASKPTTATTPSSDIDNLEYLLEQSEKSLSSPIEEQAPFAVKPAPREAIKMEKEGTLPSQAKKSKPKAKKKTKAKHRTSKRIERKRPRQHRSISHIGKEHREDEHAAFLFDNNAVLLRVAFMKNSAQLTRNAQIQLENVLSMLKDDTRIKLDLQGFADWHRRTSLATTKSISKHRAMVIRDFLVKSGIHKRRLMVTAKGLDFLPGVSRDRVDLVVRY